MKNNLNYYKKEFSRLPDNRLLTNIKYFNSYDKITEFIEEDGLSVKDINELCDFLIQLIIKRELKIPSGGYIDLINRGYKLQKGNKPSDKLSKLKKNK